MLKTTAKHVLAIVRFLRGYREYLRTGNTPESAYLAMRRLYFATNGRFNEWVAQWENSRINTAKIDFRKGGVLNLQSKTDADTIVREVKHLGYKVFPQIIPEGICKKIMSFARTTPAVPRGEQFFNFEFDARTAQKHIYDSEKPLSFIYDFDMQSLVEEPAIQELITDPSFLAIAQSYLGPSARFQGMQMWWSTANCPNQDPAAAAQMFHTDLDTISWIRFFIYITDVDSTNGAHTFVATSHKRKPKHLQREGRVTDEEVLAYYDDKVIEMTGKSGTLIIEDTKGLHKGNALTKGERLLLVLNFSTSFFGAVVPTLRVKQSDASTFSHKVVGSKHVYGDVIKVD